MNKLTSEDEKKLIEALKDVKIITDGEESWQLSMGGHKDGIRFCEKLVKFK